MMRVKLPNGSELNVPSLGVEVKLVKFLNDSSAPVTENNGFDFDRVLFDTGHATLRPVSQEQLTNIAAILKAYPQVKVGIGDYTDNTGDPAENLRLSQQRADNVMEELTRLGADASRMSARQGVRAAESDGRQLHRGRPAKKSAHFAVGDGEARVRYLSVRRAVRKSGCKWQGASP